MELVKLEKISPKKQWPHEAHDFTPWLAENLQLLGDVIGYDLELVGQEVSVGPYSADIVAQDSNTGDKIVIENQLEKTNHDHLGKCITYMSVLDAKKVVWITPEFTDEHRKAMEWLNDNTVTELEFYAIELSLLKIDKDKASVVFDKIVEPNEVVKEAKQGKKELSPLQEKQLKFWTQFRESITDKFPHPQVARAQYWYDMTMGKSGIFVSNTYNTQADIIGSRVYINSSIATKMLAFLTERKDAIEKELGFEMTWDPNPNAKDKVITIQKHFNMDESDDWNEALKWLKKTSFKIHEVFSKVIRNYK